MPTDLPRNRISHPTIDNTFSALPKHSRYRVSTTVVFVGGHSIVLTSQSQGNKASARYEYRVRFTLREETSEYLSATQLVCKYLTGPCRSPGC
jgi:hypothetical protein